MSGYIFHKNFMPKSLSCFFSFSFNSLWLSSLIVMWLKWNLLVGPQKFSVSNCSRQFWLRCTYIGATWAISFPAVLSVHQLSSFDLIIIGGSLTVIFFQYLHWHLSTERGTFSRKYNSKTFSVFFFRSAKQILFYEQSYVEDKGTLIMLWS